jgi:hypothetical protein
MKPSTAGWILVAAYATLVVVGADRVAQRTPRWPATFRGHWRAARPLAAGEQLRADDLREPDDPVERVRLDSLDALVGSHVLVPRGAGDAVARDDVGPWPRIDPPAAGRVQFVLRLDASGAPIAFAAADSGVPLYACYAPATTNGESAFVCAPDSLVVRARHVATARDSAWVIVEGDQTPGVVALIGASHRELVRAAPAANPARRR